MKVFVLTWIRILIERANFDFFGEESLFKLDEEFKSVKIYQPATEIREKIQLLYQRKMDQEPMVFEESLNDIMLQYLFLRNDFSQRIRSVPAIKQTVKKEIFRKVLYAQEFIHDNKTTQLNLEQLAKAVGFIQILFTPAFCTDI